MVHIYRIVINILLASKIIPVIINNNKTTMIMIIDVPAGLIKP